ncbi:MAG: hypothetical protein ACJA13_003812 [Paraglaciecola sp.]|jgi:hypothetical protein
MVALQPFDQSDFTWKIELPGEDIHPYIGIGKRPPVTTRD